MKTLKRTYGRSNVKFAQLDKVLRAFGFSWRPSERNPRTRIYEHEAGARIGLKPYRANERVYKHHMWSVRTELDNFGIADPTTFDAKIQKAG
ncbi:MAG: hypothetical protein HY289_06780 [Planctomycetes bacterium]|nr:hypothetical protein [Planctomycetota bacterium]